MKTPTISIKNSKLFLDSEFHPELPNAAKAVGGRWNGNTETWVFDPRDEERVRQLCIRIYGTDGSSPVTLVTLRMRLFGPATANHEIWGLGRRIARRPFRDAPVALGDGVVVIDGSFAPRGGSMRYPMISSSAITEDQAVTIEVRDVPEPLAQAALASEPNVYALAPEASQAPDNPLAAVGDDALIAELQLRGYTVTK